MPPRLLPLDGSLTFVTVQRYFGRIDCLEAQYPGLDYTFDPHRRRLATFQWHRRLFRVFDELGLTRDEILSLCNWEGTRAAKERYERESQQPIPSTTLDDVEALPVSNGPIAVLHDIQDSNQTTPQPPRMTEATANDFQDDDISDEEDTDESVGVDLNQNLIAAAAARERGEVAGIDAQMFEQWMKDAIERNDWDAETISSMLRQGTFPLGNTLTEGSTSGVQSSMTRSVDPIDEHAITRSTANTTPSTRTQRLFDAVDELRTASDRMSAETAELLHGSSTSPRLHTRPSAEHARLSTLVEELTSNNTRMQVENSVLQHFLSRTRTETAR